MISPDKKKELITAIKKYGNAEVNWSASVAVDGYSQPYLDTVVESFSEVLDLIDKL